MYQQFFKDTLVSRFIKNLLRTSDLPLYKAVEDGDFLVQGHFYVYKEFIIECYSSGKLIIDKNEKLYPSNNLFPSLSLFPSLGYTNVFDKDTHEITSISAFIARFKVIDYYSSDYVRDNYNYHSKYMYYDSDTHYYLGEYLRTLKVTHKLNLMHYYNCFNNKSIIGTYLDSTSDTKYTLGENNRYKQFAIPVKFGKTYTIALESYTPVQLRSIIYNEATGMVTRYNSSITSPEYYSDWINDYSEYVTCDFSKPFTKTICPTNDPELYAQERNLYLIIQLDKANNSSIVVLEGDYVTSNNGCINPSLLAYNYHDNYAFSDRLIEYLLESVINPLETLDGNIYYSQEAISKTFNYLGISDKQKCNYSGIWSSNIKHDITLLQKYMLEKQQYFDLDGYINVDVEKFMLQNRKEV